MNEVQHLIYRNINAATAPDEIVITGDDHPVVALTETASGTTGFAHRDTLNNRSTHLFNKCHN